jgi:hypothetical protein
VATDPGNYGGRGAPPVECVYLITVEGTWPVSAVADGPHAIAHVEREVDRLSQHPNGRAERRRVHVWRAQVTGITEMDFIPARTVEAELKPKEGT